MKQVLVDTLHRRSRHVAEEVAREELSQSWHVLAIQRVDEARDALLGELTQAQLTSDVALLRRMRQDAADQLQEVGRSHHDCQTLRHGHLGKYDRTALHTFPLSQVTTTTII